jgi:hypothetical protein
MHSPIFINKFEKQEIQRLKILSKFDSRLNISDFNQKKFGMSLKNGTLLLLLFLRIFTLLIH